MPVAARLFSHGAKRGAQHVPHLVRYLRQQVADVREFKRVESHLKFFGPQYLHFRRVAVC